MVSSRARKSTRSKTVLNNSHMVFTSPPTSQPMPAPRQNSSLRKQDLGHSSKTKILAITSPQRSHASTDKKPSPCTLDIHPEHVPQRLPRRQSSSLQEFFAEDEVNDKLVREGSIGASSKHMNSSSSSMQRTSPELSKFIMTTASETSSTPKNPGQPAQRADSLETEDKRLLLNVENVHERRQNGLGCESSRKTSLSRPTDQLTVFGEDAGGLGLEHVSNEEDATQNSGSDADKGLAEVMNVVDDEALRPLEQEFESQISDTDADARHSCPSYDQGEDTEGLLLSSGKWVPDLGHPRSTSHKEDAGHTTYIKDVSFLTGNQAEDVHHIPSKDFCHEGEQDELSFPKGDGAQCAGNSNVEAVAGTDAYISDKGEEDAGDKQTAPDFEKECCKPISDSKGNSDGEGKASSKGSNGEGFGIYPILAPLLVSSANDVPAVVDQQVIAGSSQHFDEEADNGHTALSEDTGDAHSLPKDARDSGGLHAFEENAGYTHADDLQQKGCEATASDKVKPSGSSEGVSLAQVPASSNFASQFDDNDDASYTSASTNPEQGLNCSKRSGSNIEKHVEYELHGAISPTFEDLPAALKEAKVAHGGGGGDAQRKDGQALMEKAWGEETSQLGQKIIQNKSARVDANIVNTGSTNINENPEPEMPDLHSIEDGNKQKSYVDPQHAVCHENVSKSAAQEDHLIKVSDDQFDKLLSEVEANEDNEQQPNDSRDRPREMDITYSSPRDREHEEYDISASRSDEQKSAAKMPAVPAYPLETFGGSKGSGRDHEGSEFVKPSSEGSDNINAGADCYNHRLPDNNMQTCHSFRPPHVSDATSVEDQSTLVQESDHQLMVNSRDSSGTQCKMLVPAADIIAHESGAMDASESRALHGDDANSNNVVRASNLSTLTDTAFPQEALLASNLSSWSSTGFLQEDLINKPADRTEDMDTDQLPRSKRKDRRSLGKLARGFLACCTKLRTSDF